MTAFPSVSHVIKNYNSSENAFLPKYVTVPISQSKNAFSRTVVSKGDIISEGDIIAQCTETPYSERIHSPIPGTVIDLISATSPNGKPEIAVKIKLGGSFSYLGKIKKPIDYNLLLPKEIIEKIAHKGVLNTFSSRTARSLALQISEICKRKTKALVVRMFDDDPLRITDSLVTKFYLAEVQKGAQITAKALDADGILYVFGSNGDKKEIWQDMNLSDFEQILPVNLNKYPVGMRQEICARYKKAFKKDAGFFVGMKDLFTDSSTMREVYQAVALDIPVIDKLVHFSGNCISSSCLLNVKIGTRLADIVEQLGGFEKQPALIVINGHVTGFSAHSLDVPITKYVKSVAFLSKNRKPDQFIYQCITCGNCRNVCPRNLSPDMIYLHKAEGRDVPKEYLKSAVYCSQCALCSTVCPARLPLVQVISAVMREQNSKTEATKNG